MKTTHFKRWADNIQVEVNVYHEFSIPFLRLIPQTEIKMGDPEPEKMYVVCWKNKRSSIVHRGKPISKTSAEAVVRDANSEWTYLRHWIEEADER